MTQLEAVRILDAIRARKRTDVWREPICDEDIMRALEITGDLPTVSRREARLFELPALAA